MSRTSAACPIPAVSGGPSGTLTCMLLTQSKRIASASSGMDLVLIVQRPYTTMCGCFRLTLVSLRGSRLHHHTVRGAGHSPPRAHRSAPCRGHGRRRPDPALRRLRRHHLATAPEQGGADL